MDLSPVEQFRKAIEHRLYTQPETPARYAAMTAHALLSCFERSERMFRGIDPRRMPEIPTRMREVD